MQKQNKNFKEKKKLYNKIKIKTQFYTLFRNKQKYLIFWSIDHQMTFLLWLYLFFVFRMTYFFMLTPMKVWIIRTGGVPPKMTSIFAFTNHQPSLLLETWSRPFLEFKLVEENTSTKMVLNFTLDKVDWLDTLL